MNVFKYNRIELSINIRRTISNYIGFDVNSFSMASDFAAIFGGAVRDAISNKEIHDVDVLCLPGSIEKIERLLIGFGFFKLNGVINNDIINSLYNGIHLIDEPINFSNSIGVNVQLIRPNINSFSSINYNSYSESDLFITFYNVLCNVDISCCGVYYMNSNLYQSYNKAIEHCLSNKFEILDTKMNIPERINKRVQKLESRGWKNVTVNTDFIQNKIKKQRADLFKLNQWIDDLNL